MPAFYATTAGTTWCQPLCVLLFLGTALLFLCTGAAGICPCRALSPHLHGKRFCTRCGIVTLGECPKKEHSFTYFPHHIGAMWVSGSKYWDFSSVLRPFLTPPAWPPLPAAWQLLLGPATVRAPCPSLGGCENLAPFTFHLHPPPKRIPRFYPPLRNLPVS